MFHGEFLLPRRVSSDEELLFLRVAKHALEDIRDVSDWGNPKDIAKNAGGRPLTFKFRPMLLALLLMKYHRMGYRDIESHLENNPSIRSQIGLEKVPSKSTIQRAQGRIGLGALKNLNDTIVAKFKKVLYLSRYEPAAYQVSSNSEIRV